MPSPYLPEGEDQLPANRFLLFADDGNRVQLLDESERRKGGSTFVAEWTSGVLNRTEGGITFNATLSTLYFLYLAEKDSSFLLSISADGGKTWPFSQHVAVKETKSRVMSSATSIIRSGSDIRFRVSFDKEDVIKIVGFRALLTPLGGLEYAYSS